MRFDAVFAARFPNTEHSFSSRNSTLARTLDRFRRYQATQRSPFSIEVPYRKILAVFTKISIHLERDSRYIAPDDNFTQNVLLSSLRYATELSHLELVACGSNVHVDRAVTKLFQVALWSNLRALSLSNVTIEIDDLYGFLEQHREYLRDLRLRKVGVHWNNNTRFRLTELWLCLLTKVRHTLQLESADIEPYERDVQVLPQAVAETLRRKMAACSQTNDAIDVLKQALSGSSNMCLARCLADALRA